LEARVQLNILHFEVKELIHSPIKIQRADGVSQYCIVFCERIGISKDGIALSGDGDGGP
jgi:hypothetical protein